MNRKEVERALEDIDAAREAWAEGHTDFHINVDRILRRLIHEAAANRMSAEDVARLSGYSVKRIRALMRTYDLDPKQGSRLLSKKAAEALANNAELLGIEPREMDLMSPLAYLPAGSELRKAMAAERTQGVTEVSGNEMVLLTERCTLRSCGDRVRHGELTDDENTHWHVKPGVALVPRDSL